MKKLFKTEYLKTLCHFYFKILVTNDKIMFYFKKWIKKLDFVWKRFYTRRNKKYEYLYMFLRK